MAHSCVCVSHIKCVVCIYFDYFKMATAAEGIVPKMDSHSDKSVPHSSSDVEKQISQPQEQLQRKLSSRHLQFVAIGESIRLMYYHASLIPFRWNCRNWCLHC